jgi:predicted RNase H-like HicB family nuclease
MSFKSIYIVLTVRFHQDEDDIWIADCMELGTSVYGKTFEEVRAQISEAVKIHLNTLEDVGERERFFRENNIRVHSGVPPKRATITSPLDGNIFISKFPHHMQGA